MVSTLVRFVADGNTLVAGTGRPGRGAWLCASTVVDCFDRATNQRAWPRALRTKIDQRSVDDLRAQLTTLARYS